MRITVSPVERDIASDIAITIGRGLTPASAAHTLRRIMAQRWQTVDLHRWAGRLRLWVEDRPGHGALYEVWPDD